MVVERFSAAREESASIQVPLPTASHMGKSRVKGWRNKFLLLGELLSHVTKGQTEKNL